MARLLQAALQREGHAVDSVDNGKEALWMATECDYDAIILDVMIPPPDGFEVCRTLRAEGRWAPILLLTARDGVKDRVDGLDAVADVYIRYLRDKIDRPFGRDSIETVWGVGYRLNP